MPMLIFDLEDGSPVEVPLEGRVMLGSAEGCDVLVEADGIAGHHAEIYPAPGGGYWVRDLGSSGGTFINGKRVSFQQLVPGDRLSFGPLTGRFEDMEPDAPRSASGSGTVADAERPAGIRSEFEAHESVLEKRRGESTAAEEQIEAKVREHSRLAAELETLKQNLAEQTKLKTARESEEQMHGKKLSKLQAEVADLDSRLESRRKEADALEALIEQRKAEQSGIEVALQAVRESLDGHKARLPELEKEGQERFEQLGKAHAEATARHGVLIRTLQALSQQEKKKLDDFERLQKDVDAVEARREAAQAELRDHENALVKAAEKLKQDEENQARLQSAHEELTGRHQELAGEVAQMAATLADHKSGESRLRAALENLESKLQEKNAALAIAIKDLRKAGDEHAGILDAHQALTARHEELGVQVGQLVGAISGHKEEEQRLQKLVAGLTGAHEQAGHALQEREKQLREHEAALAMSAAACKQTEEKHTGLQTAHQVLQSRHDELSAEIGKMTSAIAGHKSEEDRLRAVVQDLEKARSAAETSLKERETKLQEQNAALGKAVETLKKTEESREAARKEFESFKAGHQKLTTDARRLEAAVAGRKAEEERLRQEMKAVEARHAAAEAGMKERAAVLHEREIAIAHATEALKETGEQHAMLIAEIEQFQGQAGRLSAEVQNLGQERGRLAAENASLASLEKSLRQSVAELENSQAGARKDYGEQKAKLDSITGSYADAHSRYEALVKDLESLRTERTGLQTEMANLQSRNMALHSEVEQARFEAQRFASLAKNSRKEIESLGNTRSDLLTQKKNLESQVAQTGERLEALEGTEARLLKARDEFRRTQEAHASMTANLAAITAHREATTTHATELERQIGEMRQLRAHLEHELAGCQSRHQEVKREFEEYQAGAESSRRTLASELQELEKRSADLRSRYEAVSGKFAEVQKRHAELSEQNRNFEAALRRLDEIAENIRKSEWNLKELDGRRKSLESACADARLWLKVSTENQAAITGSIGQLEARKSALQKEIKTLTENESHERERFEELRTLNTDAEQVAAGQLKKYEEAIDVMRHEAALLEARLTRARTWNDDLDKLYARLATMPEGSPEANQFWMEIQRHKQAIAEQLPAGVQIRPGGRGQIVPRGRR